ncbi:hypothetical protein [Arthrobacter sp. Cr_A7]|uniref:DoxX family protein n=1 Tax=Arthrobacter sp. Cr_A7 TaxID=3031017 RepID=UPI0023DB290A|nr:hypothetical protein [Arthrobacter sp. Cr_A7]MDF2052160.1 hypothetical protein [Arthrobacter sp. Cr_A7]
MSSPRSGRAARILSAAAMSALLLASARQHFRNPGFYHQVVPGYLCRDDASAADGAASAGSTADGSAGMPDAGPRHSAQPPRPFAVLSREEWIAASGLLELAAAVGILVPRTRTATATGLAAMFTVFLAGHVDALRRAYGPHGTPAQRKIHTVRLPLQAPLILWAWSLRRPAPSSLTAGLLR